jgi:hypothetical protein
MCTQKLWSCIPELPCMCAVQGPHADAHSKVKAARSHQRLPPPTIGKGRR